MSSRGAVRIIYDAVAKAFVLILAGKQKFLRMLMADTRCCTQVRDAALAVDPHLVAMACGSYRRGKATCGDVDVLISHPDGKSHKGVFTKVLQSLHDSGKPPGGFGTFDCATSPLLTSPLSVSQDS